MADIIIQFGTKKIEFYGVPFKIKKAIETLLHAQDCMSSESNSE